MSGFSHLRLLPLVAAGMFAFPAASFAQTAFVWACQPTTASYNALASCGPWAYNSRGGAINIVRSGVGNYSVTFVGLGGRTTAGGHVQVTAYGGGNENCKVVSWGSGGTDFVVNVRCFALGGGNVDTRYDVLAGWFGQ